MYLKKKIIGVIQIHWDTEDPEDVAKSLKEQSSLTSRGWIMTSSGNGKCTFSKEANASD